MPRAAPVPSGPLSDTGNRTDLTAPPQAPPPGGGQPNGLPVQVPTGLPYGENQALSQDQKQVPMGAAPSAPAAPQGPPPGGQMDQAANDAQQFQMPQLGKLTRPTERPQEPVTAGITGGPQPLGQAQPGPTPGIADMLSSIARVSGSSAIAQLAQRAQSLRQ
jgi:hypothetical protein